jgi:hypothetical protein
MRVVRRSASRMPLLSSDRKLSSPTGLIAVLKLDQSVNA